MSLLKPFTSSSSEKTTGKLYRPLAFAALKDEELVAIYNVAPSKKVAEGSVLLEPGTPQDSCYVVTSGSIRLVLTSNNQSSASVVLGRGEWFGRPTSNDNVSYAFIAAEPSTLMQISPAAMQHVPEKVQSAISVGISNSLLKGYRVLAESSDNVVQRMERLTNLTNEAFQDRTALTKAFIGRYVNEIPKLPSSVSQLAVQLLDDRTTPRQVADGINRDPALAALVLQTVNSPYYGLRTKVPDHYRACLLLGFNSVYRLVLDRSVQGIMPDTEEFRGIQKHSYIVSIIAHEIAKLSGKFPASLAATAGLLHDLGKSALLLFKRQHSDLTTLFPLLDAPAVGSRLLETWELPSSIVSVVENHGRSAFVPPRLLPQEHRSGIAVLYVAHACCDLLTESGNESAFQIYTKENLSELGLPSVPLKDLYSEKIFPGIVRDQKGIPAPIKKILSIENIEDDAEELAVL